MSEYYGGDENGYYDEDGDYHQYNGGGDGSVGGGGPTGGGLPTSGYGGDGGDGSYTPPRGGGMDYWLNPSAPSGDGGGGGGMDYFNNPFTPTGRNNTGADMRGGGGGGITPSSNPTSGGGSVSNTQNNTQNNSTGYSSSVSLAPSASIASGVPQSPASSFKPNVISNGPLREGAPPPMPTPHTRVPPSLHPEKPTDWAGLSSGGSATPQATAPNSTNNHPSTLGKVGGVLGALGIIPNLKPYQGVYESLKPKKTPDQINAAMYRDLYGGQ